MEITDARELSRPRTEGFANSAVPSVPLKIPKAFLQLRPLSLGKWRILSNRVSGIKPPLIIIFGFRFLFNTLQCSSFFLPCLPFLFVIHSLSFHLKISFQDEPDHTRSYCFLATTKLCSSARFTNIVYFGCSFHHNCANASFRRCKSVRSYHPDET